MSIRIEIGEKWVITSDQHQFILNEKKLVKSGKNTGEEWLQTVGYYPKIEQLISGLIHHDVQNSAITSIKEIAAMVYEIGLLFASATERISGQYTPGLKIQNRNLSSPFRNPMYLQDPETGEIHELQHIRPIHHK